MPKDKTSGSWGGAQSNSNLSATIYPSKLVQFSKYNINIRYIQHNETCQEFPCSAVLSLMPSK